MVTPPTKKKEKKIHHVAHKAGYDIVYYTDNHHNNDDDDREEEAEDNHIPPPRLVPSPPPPPPSPKQQQQDLYKNVPVPPPPPRSFARPRLSPPPSVASSNNKSSSSSLAQKNSSNSSNNNINKMNNSNKKKKVISPPSHAFLFRQDNPHYYSPPEASASSGIASITTTTPSSSCIIGGGGFGTVRPPGHASTKLFSPLQATRPTTRTINTTTATATGACEEEEECISPMNVGGVGGGLVVPFAQTQQQDDNDDYLNDTMDTTKAVQQKQQHSPLLFSFLPQSEQGRIIMTSSTTALLSPKGSSGNGINSGHASPMFGTGSSSPVSSSLTATSQQQQQQANAAPLPMLLPDMNMSSYDYENDLNEANLQVMGIASPSTSPTDAASTLHKKSTSSSTTNNNNKMANHRRSSLLLDSTVAAATSLAAAAVAAAAVNQQQQTTTTTPRNATTSTGSSIYTSGGSGGQQQQQQAAQNVSNNSSSSGIHRLSWPSLIMGHQEIQDYCYPQQQAQLDDDVNTSTATTANAAADDDDSSSKQLLLANAIHNSSSTNSVPIINNTAKEGRGVSNNQQEYSSSDIRNMGRRSILEDSSEESSFNDESSMMHGNEGDGIMDLSHFASLHEKNRCLGRSSKRNGGGSGAATANTMSGGNNKNNNNNVRTTSPPISEWAHYARRRRMLWTIFVCLALLALLLMTILVPRTVTTARHDSIESGGDSNLDESANNNDLNSNSPIPTWAPTAEAALLNDIPAAGGDDGTTTTSNNNTNQSGAPALAPPNAEETLLQNLTDDNSINNGPTSANTTLPPAPTTTQVVPPPTDVPRARFFPPSLEPTPQLIRDTPTMAPVKALVDAVIPPTFSPTVSKKEEQDDQVVETGLTPIDFSGPWSPEPTPQLINDTPTNGPVEAVVVVTPPTLSPTPQLINDTPTNGPVEAVVVVTPPTLSPTVSKKEEDQGQVVDETQITPIDCFAYAALPLDSSILQATLVASGGSAESSTTSPNHRPTFPFCNVPPNPDWSSLIRFGPQEWFSVPSANSKLPAMVEICIDQTTRKDDSTTNTNSSSPFALNDERIVANNLNFVRPFLVLFDKKPQDSAQHQQTCEQQEENLSCQAVTEFDVPGSVVGSPVPSRDNHDFDMLANDMYDAEAEYCQSIYYPGLDKVNNDDDDDGQLLLLLAGVYGYSRRVDDILTVDFTISAKTNNECRNAVPFHLAATKTLSDTLVIQGTTEGIAGSSQDIELPPCGSTSTTTTPASVPGVWYEIQGTGEMLRLNTCNSRVENIITIYTTTITDQSDSTDTVCENLQCISDDEQSLYQEQACPASTTGGGGNSIIISTQTTQVYFVRVHPKVDVSSSSRVLQSSTIAYEEDFTATMEKKQPKSAKQPKAKKQSKKTDDEVMAVQEVETAMKKTGDEVMAAQEVESAITGGPFELIYKTETTIDDTSNMVAANSLGLCMQAKEIVLGTEQVHMYSWLASQQDEESTTRNDEINIVQDFGLLTCNDQIAVTMTGPAKWFSFVGNGEEVYINTCSDLEDETLTDFQSNLSVYSGESCDELGCVDTTTDITLARSAGFRCSSTNDSHISFVTEQGKQYYVAVHSVNGHLGDFRLKFGYTSCLVLGVPMERPMRATGDVRVGLLGNEPQPQNLAVTSTTGEAVTIQNGRFFAYYGTGGIMIASTCNGISDFEAQLSVYSDKCSSPVQIAHYESPLSCGPGREVYWKSEAGQYYYIHVSSAKAQQQVQATSLGKFGLMVSSGGGEVCATAFGPVVPAVADDDQSEVNYWALEGWTVPTLVDPMSNCGAAASLPKVYGKWYKTTGTGSTMEWHTSFHDPNEGAAISVFRGTSCEQLECVDFDESDGKVVWKSRAGEPYYVLVASSTSLVVEESTLFSVSVKQWNNVCEFTTETDFEALPTDGTVVYGRTMGWDEFTFSPPKPTITYISNCAVSELANDGRNAWYTVVGTNSTLVASACSRSVGAASLDVIVLEERTLDTGCNDLVGVSTQAVTVTNASDDTACAVSWHSEAGKLYRVVLRAPQQTDRGRFGISVMESNTQQG